MPNSFRTGLGTDIHRFRKGLPLILGGLEIPHTHGLVGHSDADALLHAVTDALLGALAEGDIGEHFPPSDSRFKNAPSTEFLAFALERMQARGYRLSNLDAVITAEAPKIAPHRGALRENLARLLECSVSQVSVKAKTAEGLDAVGARRALHVQVLVLLEPTPKK